MCYTIMFGQVQIMPFKLDSNERLSHLKPSMKLQLMILLMMELNVGHLIHAIWRRLTDTNIFDLVW